MTNLSRDVLRRKRHERLRLRIDGSSERPRLSVFRSAKYIYAQVIDATGGKVLASASTLEKDVRASHPKGAGKEAAAEVGKRIAEKARAAGVTEVAFDRAGFSYHGRVKALAEAAREGGLKF